MLTTWPCFLLMLSIHVPLNYTLWSGQPCLRSEGVTILWLQWADLHRIIFVAKIKRNLSYIHKVMTLCANWHFWEVNTLLAPCHPLPKTKIPLPCEKWVNYCAFSVCRREERQKKHDEIRKKYGKVQFISFLNPTRKLNMFEFTYSLIIAVTVLFTCVLNVTHFFFLWAQLLSNSIIILWSRSSQAHLICHGKWVSLTKNGASHRNSGMVTSILMKCTSSVAVNILSVCLWCYLIPQSLLVQSLGTPFPGGITDGVYMYYQRLFRKGTCAPPLFLESRCNTELERAVEITPTKESPG